jgi:hypothetical protein
MRLMFINCEYVRFGRRRPWHISGYQPDTQLTKIRKITRETSDRVARDSTEILPRHLLNTRPKHCGYSNLLCKIYENIPFKTTTRRNKVVRAYCALWPELLRTEIRGCIQKFPDWVDSEINNNNNTRREATQRVMEAKLTRLTHKIAIQLQLEAESWIICSSRSGRPVRKLLDTFLKFPQLISGPTQFGKLQF